jgi:hypothetical protein
VSDSDIQAVLTTLERLCRTARGEGSADLDENGQELRNAAPALTAALRLIRAVVHANTASDDRVPLPELRWDGDNGMIYVIMANRAVYALERDEPNGIKVEDVTGLPSLLAIPLP